MKPASSSFALRSFVLVAAFLLPSVSLAQFGDRPLSDEIKRLEDWCKANPKKCEMQEQQARQAQQMRQDTGGAPEKSKGEAAPQLAERFKKADTNSDGKLSREEAEKSLPGIARHFDAIDTNKDGFVTLGELEAAQKAGAEKAAAEKAKSKP